MIRFGARGKMEEAQTEAVRMIRAHLGTRSIVLVGMPGSGKSAVGRRLAVRLDLPFIDADAEIEQAAGKPITDISVESHDLPHDAIVGELITALAQSPVLAEGETGSDPTHATFTR